MITVGEGTGKSAMAKAIPPSEVIKGSRYNIAPDASYDQIDEFLKEEMEENNETLVSMKLKSFLVHLSKFLSM